MAAVTFVVQLPVEQREGIPHHLIDILDPEAEFSAGDFHSLGRRAAEDILSVSAVG
jgi:tRNA dimethylallyltransferase